MIDPDFKFDYCILFISKETSKKFNALANLYYLTL